MAQLLESVPNVSEGRRPDVVAEIAAGADTSAGANLLDVHSDPDHNRAVITLAGTPAGVSAAAFAVAARALSAIDLRQHEGVHPRMGAIDVIPLVPLQELAIEDAAEQARDLGARVARDLELPVYLYGAAALPGRLVDLARIRGRGFEALRALGPELPAPDFGPRRLHPSAGAARPPPPRPLIAFNVVLEGDDANVARRLAAGIRSGPRRLPGVQALGFWLPHLGHAQVSMNLLDYETTGVRAVVDRLRADAASEGLRLIGCETGRAATGGRNHRARHPRPAGNPGCGGHDREPAGARPQVGFGDG